MVITAHPAVRALAHEPVGRLPARRLGPLRLPPHSPPVPGPGAPGPRARGRGRRARRPSRRTPLPAWIPGRRTSSASESPSPAPPGGSASSRPPRDPHRVRQGAQLLQRAFLRRLDAGKCTLADAEAYTAWFPRPEGTITGEWTPNYAFSHRLPVVLQAVAPRTKLIVMLRDPVERYRSDLSRRMPSRDRRRLRYRALANGMYANILRPWEGHVRGTSWYCSTRPACAPRGVPRPDLPLPRGRRLLPSPRPAGQGQRLDVQAGARPVRRRPARPPLRAGRAPSGGGPPRHRPLALGALLPPAGPVGLPRARVIPVLAPGTQPPA